MTLPYISLKFMLTGLVLAGSQIANGYLVMEQRAGVAKLVTRFRGSI